MKIPRQTGTYATYLRAAPLAKLTRTEVKMLQAELDWCEANPERMRALDSLVGKAVFLKRDHTTLGGSLVYKAGTKLFVVERWMDRIHVVLIEGGRTVLQIRPEWVSRTEPKPKTKKKSA